MFSIDFMAAVTQSCHQKGLVHFQWICPFMSQSFHWPSKRSKIWHFNLLNWYYIKFTCPNIKNILGSIRCKLTTDMYLVLWSKFFFIFLFWLSHWDFIVMWISGQIMPQLTFFFLWKLNFFRTIFTFFFVSSFNYKFYGSWTIIMTNVISYV
jgi:hypothetical protein